MKNIDKPAFPLATEELSDRLDQGIDLYDGMTKLEYTATKLFQGFLSGKGIEQSRLEELRKEAICQAYHLLTQIEESGQKVAKK